MIAEQEHTVAREWMVYDETLPHQIDTAFDGAGSPRIACSCGWRGPHSVPDFDAARYAHFLHVRDAPATTVTNLHELL